MPFNGYAPVENHVYHVATELGRRGHEVAVVARYESKLGREIELIPAEDESEEKAYGRYRDRLKGFDCILDFSNLKFTYLYKHDEAKDLRLIGCCYPYQAHGYTEPPPVVYPNFVVTSEAMGKAVSAKLGVSYRVVPYGVPKVAGSNPARKGRLLYLGRVMKEKGVQLFVDLCRRTRIGGDILGEDVNVPDSKFVIRLLKRCDGRLIRMYGRSPESLKHKLLANAKCVILPYLEEWVAWACLPEIEALAHGVPVLAFKKGAIEEFVADGVSGILCTRLEELAEAIEKIDGIDSGACMKVAERFTVEKSVDKYEALITGCERP